MAEVNPFARFADNPFAKFHEQQAPAPAASTPPAPVQQPEAPQGNAPLYVIQQADRGIADALGAPVDLTALALNLGLTGADKLANLFGGNVDFRVTNPVGGSDWIAEQGAKPYEAAGGTIVAPEDVGHGARIAGNAARFASGAAVPLSGLASRVESTGLRLVDELARPYKSAPGATVARDLVAGAGAGAGSQLYDEAPIPDAVRESSADPIIRTILALAGGSGGMLLESGIEGGLKGLVNKAINLYAGKGDPNAPFDPSKSRNYTRPEMDMAARIAQDMPTNKAQALDNIDQGAKEFSQFASKGETPTVGMLADDVGMAVAEKTFRGRNETPFIQRDNLRKTAAADAVDRAAPANADGMDFTGEATRQYNETLRNANSAVDEAAARRTAAQTDIQSQNTDLGQYGHNQDRAAQAVDQSVVDNTLKPMTEANARAYAAIDPQRTEMVDATGLVDTAAEVRKSLGDLNDPNKVIPSGLLAKIDNVAESAAEAGTPPQVAVGDLASVIPEISRTVARAEAAGNYTLADSLRKLRDGINTTIDQNAGMPGADAAIAARENYKSTLGETFGQGPADEATKFRKDYLRDQANRSATPPSQTASRFLGSTPEKAAALKRIGAASSDPQQAEQAAYDWMLGDLAKSGALKDNAQLRYDAFRKWADRNKGTIDQFPTLRQRVDTELANAQKGGELSAKLEADVVAAKNGLRDTESQLRNSALQHAIGNNPENAVRSIMGSGDPEARMTEMVQRLAGNQDALDGLKAATRDWIKNRAEMTSEIVGSGGVKEVSRANLDRLFNRYESVLAKVYTPDEMNALRQAHKLLAAGDKLNVRATAGSDTFSKIMAELSAKNQRLTRMLDAGLRARFGMLKGGGIMRTINLVLSTLPNKNAAIEDILTEMFFNPELAKHLLTRPIEDINSPMWNAKLNALLATAAGARDAVGDGSGNEDRKPLKITVHADPNRDKEN